MNRPAKSKTSKQSSISDHFPSVKQEIVDDNVNVCQIEPTSAHESQSCASCQSMLKCEYDPDCGCKQCRFNANRTSGALQQIKIENELTYKCVKDEVCDEEDCGCAECTSVVLSRQKFKKERIKPETIIRVQPQTNDDQTINQDSDYTKSYFRRSARVVNNPKITYTYRDEFSENDESDYEPSDEESGRDEDTELEDNIDIVENNSRLSAQKSKQTRKSRGKKSNKKFKSSEDSIDDEGAQRNLTQSANLPRILTLRLNCPECDETFKDHKTLNLHLKNRHKILHKRCYVKGCSASFSMQHDLERHLRSEHKGLTNNWPCGHCNLETFKNHSSLSEHMGRMHQKGYFKCAYNGCSVESDTRIFLYNHYKSKHNEATFECQVEDCGKIFKIKESLKQHSHVHTGKKLFKCEHCECSFTAKQTLKTHLANVHQIGKMFQYKCTWPKCKFVSNSRPNAMRHIKNMHLKTGAKHNPKKFLSKEELVEKPINKKIEMAKKCFKNEVVNGTARECVCDECVFALLSKQSDKKHVEIESVQPTSDDEQLINQDLDYVNDCPTPDYLPPFFSEDEDEEGDEDDEVNDSFVRIFNKPRIAYQEEYFETQSGCDYEPSDDGEGAGDVDEDSEVESDAETPKYNVNSSSITKSKQFQEKPNKKSKQSHSKSNRPNESNLDEDVHQSERKLSGNGFPLKILTLQLNCSACDKTFDDVHLLDKHLKDRHDILKLRCLVRGCSASFSYSTYAMRHQQSEHSDCINNWPCGQCLSKKFKSYKILSNHVWKEHQTGIFRCVYEGCQFESNTNRLSVIKHIRWEHLKNKFACKVEGCGMSFCNQNKLNRHSNVHTREKPYECEYCESSYTNEQNLKHHLAKVHQVGKLYQFKCEWPNCKYVSSRRGHAVRHIRDVHFKKDKQRDPREFISQTESIQNPSKDKPKEVIIIRLNCPVDDCSDHFPDKTQLTDHLSKCHRIEKFRCMQRGCLASFVNKSQLCVHLKVVHENLKEWHCAKCEYKGKTHNHLSTHVSIVHEEGVFVCGIDGCRFVSRTNSTAVANHRSIEHKQLKKH